MILNLTWYNSFDYVNITATHISHKNIIYLKIIQNNIFFTIKIVI